jgi:Zn-dependent protease with chaperone function
MAKKGVFCGIVALLGAAIFRKVRLVGILANLERYKEKAQRDPFPDSPEKRKLAEVLIKEGYEVYFIKAKNIGIFAYGKKVGFSLPYNNEHTFFTDPYYASCRKGFIAHELGHIHNKDIVRRICFEGTVAALTGIATGLAATRTATIIQSPFFSHLLKGFKGSPLIQKTLGLTLRTSAILVTTAIVLCLNCGLKPLANAAFVKYLEHQADVAVVNLQDPLALDGMAQHFEERSKGEFPNKTWKEWFADKTEDHPTNASRALFFRKEAAKMRKRQLSV